MNSVIADLGLILLLIILNGFFVAVEIAYVSVRRTRLSELADEGDRRALRAQRLLRDPGRFLAVIQVAITFLGALASAVAAVSIVELLSAPLSGISWIGDRAAPIALLLVTLLVSVFSIVLGELIPKGFALANPDRIALVASGPISLFAKVLSPLVGLLVLLTKVISKPFGIDPTRTPELSAAEIRLIVEQGSQQGVLEAEEEQMISAVMSLSDSKLHEVMVPRIDISAIDEEATFDEAVEVVLKEGHSRTPLYRESIDHVTGVLYAKDLLRIIAAGGPRPRLRDIMRPALFVPESQSVDDLLHELQRRKVHMAIVLDEYGGTAGLVTIEDLLEEIVGEIQDEFDEEEPMKVEIGPGEVVLDGRADIDELTNLIDPPLELEDDEEYDTLGGFVYHRIGRVPVVGDSVTVARHEVLAALRHRLSLFYFAAVICAMILMDLHGADRNMMFWQDAIFYVTLKIGSILIVVLGLTVLRLRSRTRPHELSLFRRAELSLFHRPPLLSLFLRRPASPPWFRFASSLIDYRPTAAGGDSFLSSIFVEVDSGGGVGGRLVRSCPPETDRDTPGSPGGGDPYSSPGEREGGCNEGSTHYTL